MTPVRLGSVLCLFGVLACSTTAHLQRAETAFSDARYEAAVADFSRALKDDPDNLAIQRRLLAARTRWVESGTAEATALLQTGAYAEAARLVRALQALPLSLDQLEERSAIEGLARKLEGDVVARIEGLEKEGHSIAAAKLASAARDALPQRDWLQALESRLSKHHLTLARRHRQKGLIGAAALQTAIAHAMGATEVPEAAVRATWDELRGAACLQPAAFRVRTVTPGPCERCDAVAATLEQTLTASGLLCDGEGGLPAEVVIDIERADIQASSETETFLARVDTTLPRAERVEEVVVPTVELRDVEDVDVRIEKIPHRDCAPRPGEARRCREWIEEKRHETRVTRRRVVPATRTVKRPRPLAADAVTGDTVPYDRTWVEQGAVIAGRMTVSLGGTPVLPPQPFLAVRHSAGSQHDVVLKEERVLLPASPSPLPEKMMQWAEVVGDLGDQVAAHLKVARTHWRLTLVSDGLEASRRRAYPRADDALMRALVLDGAPPAEANAYFLKQYGLSVKELAGYLRTPRRLFRAEAASGSDVPTPDAAAVPRVSGGIPTPG